MRLYALLVLFPLGTLGTSARAHSGGASIATLTTPAGVGVVTDESFELRWTDADRRFETSTVTFDFFYTRVMPPTAPPGVLPFGIEGRLIAVAVDEIDPLNRLVWNTASIPAGSYVLWSVASEEPPDLPLTMVSFSRGVVTVAHPGDPVHPAVLVGIEQEFSASDQFLIPYEAFDPTGTASVTLSVSPRFDGSEAVVLAAGVPASSRGEYRWAVEAWAPGRYAVRAKISDARGLSFHAYARFYLRVDPGAPPTPDAGSLDLSATPDAELDAGLAAFDAEAPKPEDSGPSERFDTGTGTRESPGACACSAASSAMQSFRLPWALALLLLRRRPMHPRL